MFYFAFCGQSSPVGYDARGCKASDVTEQLTTVTMLSAGKDTEKLNLSHEFFKHAAYPRGQDTQINDH